MKDIFKIFDAIEEYFDMIENYKNNIYNYNYNFNLKQNILKKMYKEGINFYKIFPEIKYYANFKDIDFINNNEPFVIEYERGLYYVKQRKNKFHIIGKDGYQVIKITNYDNKELRKRIKKINSIKGFDNLNEIIERFNIKYDFSKKEFDVNLFLKNILNDLDIIIKYFRYNKYNNKIQIEFNTSDNFALKVYLDEYFKVFKPKENIEIIIKGV